MADAEPATEACCTPSTVALDDTGPRVATTTNSGAKTTTRPDPGSTAPRSSAAARVDEPSPTSRRWRTLNRRTNRALTRPSTIIPAALAAKTRLNRVAVRPCTSCSANDEPEM